MTWLARPFTRPSLTRYLTGALLLTAALLLPAGGDAHRQEYWPGHAEDQYWLVDLASSVSVPRGAFAHAARTLEWSIASPPPA